jgi:hypothetical protein
MDTLPHLKRIELRGLCVREEHLLAFIQRTGVRKLFMINVSMSSGTFRSVFDYCTSNAAGMEHLHFHELVERHLRVYFDGPGHSLLPPLTGRGADTLERKGAELRQQISYRAMQSAPQPSSPFMMEHRQRRRREYGTPFRGTA